MSVYNTPNHEVVTPEEVRLDAPIVAEFLDYFRWLSEYNAHETFDAAEIWHFFYESIRIGRVFSEVAEDLNLPIPESWK